jgi:hypothetical protein
VPPLELLVGVSLVLVVLLVLVVPSLLPLLLLASVPVPAWVSVPVVDGSEVQLAAKIAAATQRACNREHLSFRPHTPSIFASSPALKTPTIAGAVKSA